MAVGCPECGGRLGECEHGAANNGYPGLRGDYIIGNPDSHFAVMRYRGPWRLSPLRPAGGIVIGHIGIWWRR